MPRGAKRDSPLTKMLRANGLLVDARSFVGYQADMTPHLYLKGADIIVQRVKVWESSGRKCGLCKKLISEPDWELDHKQGGLVGRCDCLSNLQPVCRPCHRAKHVQVRLRSIPMEAA